MVKRNKSYQNDYLSIAMALQGQDVCIKHLTEKEAKKTFERLKEKLEFMQKYLESKE